MTPRPLNHAPADEPAGNRAPVATPTPSATNLRGNFLMQRQSLSLIASPGRGSIFERPPPNRPSRKLLVREREDDDEGDHNKSDRVSIKSFPIDVNTHRTALLFAEVTATQ
jgi:hypothetical protein